MDDPTGSTVIGPPHPTPPTPPPPPPEGIIINTQYMGGGPNLIFSQRDQKKMLPMPLDVRI